MKTPGSASNAVPAFFVGPEGRPPASPARFRSDRKPSSGGAFLSALAVLLCLTGGIFPVLAAGPLTLAPGPAGRLHVADDDRVFLTLTPTAANQRWNFTRARSDGKTPEGAGGFLLTVDQIPLAGTLRVKAAEPGATAEYLLQAREAVAFNTLAVATDFEVPALAGTVWQADDRRGEFPAGFGGTHVFAGTVRRLVIRPRGMPELAFSFPQPAMVLLQDNRLWGDASFSLRIGRGAGSMAAGEAYSLTLTLEGATFTGKPPAPLEPVVIAANEEWIPLQPELEIVPGSALDLSTQGFVQGPCGAKGRVIATPDGHFAFADEPGRPRRFYGVNLCYSAQFLSRDRVDRLLDRLVRLGYNTVRIHHYESGLTTPGDQPGFDWDPQKVDQLDYLMAGCAKRGLWLTTDLYVSRPVGAAQIGREGGRIEMDRFKILVPVHEGAFRDWAAFARKFLDRVNPHTGLRVADDPALAWISLINEGPLTNFWGEICRMPEWQAAWTKWVRGHMPDPAIRERILGAPDAEGRLPMPPSLAGDTPASRLAGVFVAAMEKASYERMRDFLRNDLRCEALLTNMNNAAARVPVAQLARAAFDYVDEHFYVDHPHFLEKPWRLPSSSPNANPIPAGVPGGANVAAARLFGKPFTITEYNYAGPGRFRGVGGILTGALGALQDWDAMWRFAYSHHAGNLFKPAPMGYFDLASDPLNQAADRLTLFLYLRGDVSPAAERLAVVLTEADWQNFDRRRDVTLLQSAAWRVQVGTVVVPEERQIPAGLTPLPADPVEAGPVMTAVLAKARENQVSINTRQAVLTVDTPRSAGGYAETGGSITTADVTVDELTHGATVFVNSLDAAPISTSRRLLVTHLTDLQNTGCHYAERARQTLLDWGRLPYLVRAGSARVRLATARPEKLTVWALSPGGRRIEKVPSRVAEGRLVFTVDVRGADGARMLYEIAEK